MHNCARAGKVHGDLLLLAACLAGLSEQLLSRHLDWRGDIGRLNHVVLTTQCSEAGVVVQAPAVALEWAQQGAGAQDVL